ncbi:MAG: response regulator [Flavobacteriales bacterium]|nr:response regulator [Flavobacteriales bacterium]
MLDINLGDGADGVQLAEKVKAKHRMPFIFVTSHSDKATLERVKPLRPAGFIIKPFDENDLRTQIELALARYANDVEATAAPAMPSATTSSSPTASSSATRAAW